MKLKHCYAKVDGINIHYVDNKPEVRDETVTTIVFLHGFPEYWQAWQQQLEYFSTTHRVIAPDLPGYNLSDKPTDSSFYQVPNLLNFIANFIETVSPNQQVILVAHDWGGAIAWPVTAFHARLIKKLVILNAAHPSAFTREMATNPKQRAYSEYIHDLISASAEEMLIKDNYHYLSDVVMVGNKPDLFSEKTKARYRQAWQQSGAITGMLQYYRAMPQLATSSKSHDTTSEKENSSGPIKDVADMKIPNIRIEVPTLILWGEQDKAFVKENLDNLDEYIPNCQIERFPNASHWLCHEEPDRINQAIDTFIR